MGKKQKEKQAPPPPPPPPASPSVSSSSSSSQDDEDSPPPSISPVEKLHAASTATRLPKPPEPSSDSTGSDEEEDDSSEGEEESKEVESSEDSGAAAATKSNPPSLPQRSPNAIVKRTQNNAASSGLVSEDDEEDGGEEDSSSESGPSPPPPQSAGNAGQNKTATPIANWGEVSEEEEEDDDDESEDSSDSDQTAPSPPPRSSSENAADSLLKPLSSKPMDGPAQTAEKKPISGKRAVPSASPATEKKRITSDGVAGGKGKKENIFKRIWSMEDELALLQGIYDYKEQHHIIPSSAVLMAPLIESVKDSLSISVNRSQIHMKIRKLRLKYNNAAKRVKGGKNPKCSNPHDAAVFNLSKKIWGSSKEGSQFLENKIEDVNVKDTLTMGKGKQKHSSEEYNSMQILTKSKAPYIATLLPLGNMSSALGGQFDGRCKKSEIHFLQIQGKKQKIYHDALKLIEDALSK